MRFGISYRLHFRYSEAVFESQNEVRARPRDDDYQRVLSYTLISRPEVAVLSVLDYWGTTVQHLGIRAPHVELELVAQATVETKPHPQPGRAPALAALSDEKYRSDHFEFLVPSAHVLWQQGDLVEQRAIAAAAKADSVEELVSAVVAEVRSTLVYRQDCTDIGVTLLELIAGGEGVCQDFAHLALGMLRSVGVPCRYVSGYLFAANEADSGFVAATVQEDLVSVQTHAWIEVAVPGWGWWALDPTNGVEVGEHHVVIGYGRDYADVPPVRGVFAGSAVASVDAEVVISRQSTQNQQ
ncbi:MAG: transglutaminase family protein [Acidimicrobiia bacterium]|nr:transglutaminase family protein [Acidimicrobiia bacterium]MCY4457970.1 transglutaminase family protein [Acidimicrobiaceae bacterium]